MEPIWYVNKLSGLVVLENGGIVEWENFQKVVSKERLDAYLCHCNIKKKRKPSMNAIEYQHYRAQVEHRHEINSYRSSCDCDDCL